MTYVYRCIPNDGCSENRGENNWECEDVDTVIKNLFSDGKKRKSPVVAYKHVINRAANVKKGFDMASLHQKYSKYHMIKVTHFFLKK